MSLLFPPTPAQVTLIDSFEDSDISEYGGDTGGSWQFDSTGATDGSVALRSDTGKFDSISSTSGLGAYPSQGDTYKVDLQWASGDEQIEILYATQSESSLPNGYRSRIDGGSNKFTLRESGSGTQLASTNFDLSKYTSDTVTWRVVWSTSGDHDLALLDSSGATLASISAKNTTYSSGGIGFTASSSGPGQPKYWDFARIE